jgi:hypothetical protein
MSAHSWTADDPRRGDSDATTLDRIGNTRHDVVSHLLRDVDRSAA